MPHRGPYGDTESARAAVSKARGKASVSIKDPKKRRDYIARQGKVEVFGGGFAPMLRRSFLEHGEEGSEPTGRWGQEVKGEFPNPSRSKPTVGIDSHVVYEK